MNIRFLEAEEYGMLDAIPDPDKAKVDPGNTLVAAAFDGEHLVGRLVAINLPHIECAWIDPEYRSGTLPQRVESVVVEKMRELGAKKVLAFAVDDRMEDYCRRLGYRKFATAWEKEI